MDANSRNDKIDNKVDNVEERASVDSRRFTDVEYPQEIIKLPATKVEIEKSTTMKNQAMETVFDPMVIRFSEKSIQNPLMEAPSGGFDIEMGTKDEPPPDTHGHEVELVLDQDFRHFHAADDVGWYGRLWRKLVKFLLLITSDHVNALRITRGIQVSLPYQSSYEAHLLRKLVLILSDHNRMEFVDMPVVAKEAKKSGKKLLKEWRNKSFKELSYTLDVIFQNRNATRILLRNMMARWDYFFHQDDQFKNSIFYDVLGVTFGFFGFPVSENFINTRNFTIASIFRLVLGRGNFATRTITGRQALYTDNPDVIAQNLAAEGTGFEAANRAQWGTYLGRIKTNQFRAEHRLPTDESIVRSFMTSPLSTCVNNGIEHVLRQLIQHWRNMLYQPFGNFAHQRMEQLNPVEILRFHFPVMLVVLSQLRGLNRWDATVLGPFITKLQSLNVTQQSLESLSAGSIPTKDQLFNESRNLIQHLKAHIVVPVCGGIAARIQLLNIFLDTILEAMEFLCKEADEIRLKIQSIVPGLDVACSLINEVDWSTPAEAVLSKTIYEICRGLTPTEKNLSIPAVNRALNLLAPKDKRTLIELCKNGYQDSHPARLLLKRTKTLLKRELQRDALDQKIRQHSRGGKVESGSLKASHLYWLIDRKADILGKRNEGVYSFQAQTAEVLIFQNFYTANVMTVDRKTMEVINTKENINIHEDNSHSSKKKKMKVSIYEYVIYAEEIVKAQKMFMDLELEHNKRFSFEAFMEFSELRQNLLQLATTSQLHCEALDDARLNILRALQMDTDRRLKVSWKDVRINETFFVLQEDEQYVPFVVKDEEDSRKMKSMLEGKTIVRVPPQSTLVIGSGPTGLLATIHCLESVLLSGGTMRLYESRDAYQQSGATFERSQIVRLDARWISMLRFHLGTIYEDVFVPASGETDSHYGNSLPFQGFIEITIKDLENMINIQVAKALSRGLLQHDTNSNVQYNFSKNELVKNARALKLGDLLLRKFDCDGNPSSDYHSWKIVELIPPKKLEPSQLQLDKEYVVYLPAYKTGLPFKLVGIHTLNQQYSFHSLDGQVEDFTADSHNMPAVYKKGTLLEDKAPGEFIVLQSVLPKSKKNATDTPSTSPRSSYAQQTLTYQDHEKSSFLMDIGHVHVVTATGKPHDSDHHFQVTTEEPYGVCCLSGLKVSMNMHNFGTGRWENGLLDDIRSLSDQNTRVIGDFTKVVNSHLIAKKMVEVIEHCPNWRAHFEELVIDHGLTRELARDVYYLLSEQVKCYLRLAPYKRHHLQTRFFETGDNFYLGMEFTREYSRWKKRAVESIIAPIVDELNGKTGRTERHEKRETMSLKGLRSLLHHHLDRLWYFAALEVIRIGDVYNPGGREFVPQLFVIDYHVPVELGTLPVGETFILVDDKDRIRYEVLVKTRRGIIVRNHEGIVSTFLSNRMVRIGGNLTRGPDGLRESKVALSTFPVSHLVNYRSMKLSNSVQGYTIAFLGDEQSSPHFMRYSGLTGAAINIMSFNNFLTTAIEGIPFMDRFYVFSAITNWSNGEVVTRGTSSNYGVDGFLRPGFSYLDAIKYLFAKITEHMESGQDLQSVLSRDWKTKFAAALIPRGLELRNNWKSARKRNHSFYLTMNQQIEEAIYKYVQEDILLQEYSVRIPLEVLSSANEKIQMISQTVPINKIDLLLEELQVVCSAEIFPFLQTISKTVSILRDTIQSIFDHAQALHDANLRISSMGELQPKSVDSFIDIFAPESQLFASNLAQSSTFAVLTLGLRLITRNAAIVSSAASLWYSLGTITNGSRYKNRHEEWITYFHEQRFMQIVKRVFACMKSIDRKSIPLTSNPFYLLLEQEKDKFLDLVYYYDYSRPIDFLQDYQRFIDHFNEVNEISKFLELLESKYIAVQYHENTYLQEKLVEIYFLLEEMYLMEITYDDNHLQAEPANDFRCLFERLLIFQPNLSDSLQHGRVAFGAFRITTWEHGHLMGILRFFLLKTWKYFCSYRKSPKTIEETQLFAQKSQPLIIETKEILQQMTSIQSKLPDTKTTVGQRYSLHREIVDIRELSNAMHESALASCLITSGLLNFCSGIIFFCSNLALLVDDQLQWAQRMSVAADYSFGIITPWTSILAVYFFRKHFLILRECDLAVKGKILQLYNNSKQQAPSQHQPQEEDEEESDEEDDRDEEERDTKIRKSSNLSKRQNKRGNKRKNLIVVNDEAKKDNLYTIRRVAKVKESAIFLRIIASLLAAIALPWVLAADIGNTYDEFLPLYLGIMSASLQIFTALYLYLIEYLIIYRATPLMGELCCSSFDQEILGMKHSFTIQPRKDWLPKQSLDREVWEYVAKEFLHQYRFDTIYSINRFGSIMQYLHSGCLPSSQAKEYHISQISSNRIDRGQPAKKQEGGDGKR